MPLAAAPFDAILRGKGGRQRGPGKTLLFDVARGLAHRVPLTKLVELDGDVHPVSCHPDGSCPSVGGQNLGSTKGHTHITMMTREAFKNMLFKEASHNYNNYGLVSR